MNVKEFKNLLKHSNISDDLEIIIEYKTNKGIFYPIFNNIGFNGKKLLLCQLSFKESYDDIYNN